MPRKQTEPIRKRVGEYLEQGAYTAPELKIARFCKNLLANFSSLWTFIFIDQVEPTNNHAERCLRQAVIWRKKYFGTRSDYRSQFVARMMSLITTSKLQSNNAFLLLTQFIDNYFKGITQHLLI